MNENVSKMSIEELEALVEDLTGQAAEIRERQRVVQAVLDGKRAKERARRMVEGMSDAERLGLAQALAAGGIGSGEAFGEL